MSTVRYCVEIVGHASVVTTSLRAAIKRVRTTTGWRRAYPSPSYSTDSGKAQSYYPSVYTRDHDREGKFAPRITRVVL